MLSFFRKISVVTVTHFGLGTNGIHKIIYIVYECEWNDFPSTLLCSRMPRLNMLMKCNVPGNEMKTSLFFLNYIIGNSIIFHFQGVLN